MAKLETTLTGSIDQWARRIEAGLLEGSVSASVADRSEFQSADGESACRVLVFERFSMLRGRWVCMNVTLFRESTGLIHCSAITCGSGSADLFGIGALGEGAFLDCLREILEA